MEPRWSRAVISAALLRAEERMAACRRTAPDNEHGFMWKDHYIHRYEWHREWLDHGRTILAGKRYAGRE